MADEVESRVLQLFRVRMQRDPTISAETIDVLLDGGGEGTFGDDDQLLAALVESRDER